MSTNSKLKAAEQPRLNLWAKADDCSLSAKYVVAALPAEEKDDNVALAVPALAAVGAVGAGAVSPAATAAAAPSQFIEVPGNFQMMRDAATRVDDYHAAEKNLADASTNKLSADTNLSQAESDRAEAIKNLREAKAAADATQATINDTVRALIAARTESSARTVAAIAAQQAVADYLPNYYAQQTRVQELSSRVRSLEASRPADTYSSTPSGVNGAQAERIRRAWESVGYEPGRLDEVRQMVGEGVDVATNDYDNSAEIAAYDARISAAESELDYAESQMDAVQSELDRLVDVRSDAEAEEADARAAVKELEAERMTLLQELAANEQWIKDAEDSLTATGEQLAEARAELAIATEELATADHDLKHFGEGVTASVGMEYYNWNGAASHGHQLVNTYGVDYEFNKGSVALNTGLVKGSVSSNAADPRNNATGSVSGMTDTTLSATYKNDHKEYSTHYTLDFNLPTGKSDASPFASVPDLLARYTTYGEGFNVTPGIEGIKHITERDTLSARLTYSIRSGYDTTGYTEGYEENGVWTPTTLNKNRVDPGNQTRLQLSYLHAGEEHQLYSYAAYQMNSDTTSRNLSTGETTRYRDGNGWEAGVYYSQDMDKRSSWQSYLYYTSDGATTGNSSSLNRGMKYVGLGTGMRYKVDKDQQFSLLTQYLKGIGAADSWRTGLGNEDPSRLSLMLGYDWRIDEVNNLKVQLERYRLHDKSSGNATGWSIGTFFNRSF